MSDDATQGFDPAHAPAHLRVWCEDRAPHIAWQDGAPIKLSGGLMNEVWRLAASPRDLVFKWAPPYIASVPEIEMASNRIVFEARALELVKREPLHSSIFGPTHDETWRFDVPEVHVFDEGSSAMLVEFIEDARTLEQVAGVDEASMRALYAGWGGVIGRLHAHTSGARWRSELAMQMRHMAVQRTREQVQYGAVRGWLEQVPWIERGVIEALSGQMEALGRRFVELDGACLVMGDSWPRSVLVEQSRRQATIIDWEFAHFGQPAQDVGHVLAHIWMMGHVREQSERHTGYASAWLRAYRAQLEEHGAEALLSASHQLDSALHYIAELLARTLGSFVTEACYMTASHEREEALAHGLSVFERVRTSSPGRAHDCLLTGM